MTNNSLDATNLEIIKATLQEYSNNDQNKNNPKTFSENISQTKAQTTSTGSNRIDSPSSASLARMTALQNKKIEENGYDIVRPPQKGVISSSLRGENLSNFSDKLQDITHALANFLDTLTLAKPAIIKNTPQENTASPLPSHSTQNTEEIAHFLEESLEEPLLEELTLEDDTSSEILENLDSQNTSQQEQALGSNSTASSDIKPPPQEKIASLEDFLEALDADLLISLENESASPQNSSPTLQNPSPSTGESPEEIAHFIENITLDNIPLLQGSLKTSYTLNPNIISLLTRTETLQDTQDSSIFSLSQTPEELTNPASFTKELSRRLHIPTRSFIFHLQNQKINIHLPISKEALSKNTVHIGDLTKETIIKLTNINSSSREAISLALLMAELTATSKIITNFILYRQEEELDKDEDHAPLYEDHLLQILQALSNMAQRTLREKKICLNNGEDRSVFILFKNLLQLQIKE